MADKVSAPMLSEIDNAGLGAAFMAAISWASTGIFIRFLHEFSAASIIAGRCAFALVGAGLLLSIRNRKPSVAHIFCSATVWILSLLMIGYYIIAVIAFQLAPVGEVALIISTSPLFALVYRRLRGIPITVSELSGALIAIIGVALVAASGAESPEFHPSVASRLSGDGLAIAGSAVMASYSIFYSNVKRTDIPSSRIVTFLTFLVGTILLGTWLVIFEDGHEIVRQAGQINNLLLFAGLGLGSTVLPTLCYSIASHKLSSLLSTSIRLLTPLLSAFLAMIILNEIPRFIFWPGMVLILAGLYLIIIRKGK